MGKKSKQRESLLLAANASQSQALESSNATNMASSSQINQGEIADNSQIDGTQQERKKKRKQKRNKENGDVTNASQMDATAAVEDETIDATQPMATNQTMEGDIPAPSDKKSKKRKRKSEAVAAENTGVQAQEVVFEAAAEPEASQAMTEGGEPSKKKKKKNREKRRKSATQQDNDAEAAVNGDDTGMADETQGIDETVATVNGDGADADAVAAEKQRKRERKQRKKEKREQEALLASQSQIQNAAEAESDNADIPVPQLSVNGRLDDEDDPELEAPPADQSVILPTKKSKKDKKAKKDKGKGKEKAAPLFQPEEISDNDDDVEPPPPAQQLRQEEREMTDYSIPELPPPLSSRRKTTAAARAKALHQENDNGAEGEGEEENENIDPSLMDPPAKRRSARTAAAANRSSKIAPSNFSLLSAVKSSPSKPVEGETSDDDGTEGTDSERGLLPAPTPARKRGRPTKEAAAAAKAAKAAEASASKTTKKAPATSTTKPVIKLKKPATAGVVKGRKNLTNTNGHAAHALPPSQNSDAHNTLLATKWLDTKALNELKEEGLFYKTGKFSEDEDATLRSSVEFYQARQGLSDEQIMTIMFSKGGKSRKENDAFWSTLAEECTDRPLQSVFHHVRRMYQPDARQGAWTPEQDAALRAAVSQLGEKWEQVGERVGRWSQDCRDRYRNHIGSTDKNKNTGQWTKAEENKLRKVINAERLKKGMHFGSQGDIAANGDDDSEVFWTAVASRFGGSRTRAQCRIKWNDNMRNKMVDEKGRKLRWGRRDTYILIRKLNYEGAERQSDINWASFIDPGEWDWFSTHVLTKRFATMRARALRALGKEDAPYPEILKWLVEEQDAIPKQQLQKFMAAGPQRERGGGDDDDEDEEDELEEDDEHAELEAEPVKSAKRDKGKGRAVETPAKKATPSTKGKKATTSKAPRSAKSATASAKAGTSKKGPEQFRTKEFISDSDEGEDE